MRFERAYILDTRRRRKDRHRDRRKTGPGNCGKTDGLQQGPAAQRGETARFHAVRPAPPDPFHV